MTAIPKSKAKTAYGLLSEVRKLIQAEPLRYDQTTYIARASNADDSAMLVGPNPSYPSYGTVGCVAGWVATLKLGAEFTYGAAPEVAQRILGLTHHQRMHLFGVPDATFGNTRPQTLAHVKAGLKHIAAFQKKHATRLKATRV